MKNYSNKRVMCLVLCLVMCISLLVGCGTTDNKGDTVVSGDVVATIDGKEITRDSVGTDLLAAEQEVISSYINSEMLSTFFKDVKITDEEVNLQLELMKSQVGEDNWPMYLVYYGGGSEETFKTTLKQSMRQEKYISEKANGIEVTDEELATKYNENPDNYNIAVLDVLFFSDVETLNKGIALMNEGKSLEEIATSVGLTISNDEHTYYNSENLKWSKSFSESKVGDMLTTDSESGSLVIGRIKALNAGLDNTTVKEDILSNIRYEKAYDLTEKEYVELLKKTKVEIMGQPYSLYDNSSELEDTNSIVD